MSQTHVTITNTEFAVWSFEDIKSTSNLYHPTIAKPAQKQHNCIKMLCYHGGILRCLTKKLAENHEYLLS